MKETTSLVRFSYQAIKKKRLRLSPKAILLVMVMCYSCHGVFASPRQRERLYSASDFKRAAPKSEMKEVEKVVNMKGAEPTGSEKKDDPDDGKKNADPVDEMKGSESLRRIDGPDEDVDNVRTELVSSLKREVARVRREENDDTTEAFPNTTGPDEPLEDEEGEDSTHLPLGNVNLVITPESTNNEHRLLAGGARVAAIRNPFFTTKILHRIAPNTEGPAPKPANPPPEPKPRPKQKGPGIFRNCPTNGMECADKLCVHYHKWCDGVKDCGDGTDEQPATCKKYSCPFGFKKCKNNLQCVREERLCDGVQKDCQDNSDESADLCRKEMLECKAKGGGLWPCGKDDKCIPLHSVCDGVNNCNKSNADESSGLCENWKCLSGYRKCADQRRCVPEEWICNGWYDCEDRSDEINCDSSMACRPGFRMCRDKTECIRETDFCNERTDCSDDSDEEMCDRWTCFPGTLPCKDKKQCMPVEEFCNMKRGCNDGSDESPILCRPKEGCTCPLEWGNCSTVPETCFPLSAKCDGVHDCDGGSDEQDCDHGVKCLDDNLFWKCQNRKECVLEQQRCDGVKNCEDGSDEINCENRHCLPGLRKCLDNNQCLPDAWFCNTKRDCNDKSDEMFCEKKMSLGRMNSTAASNIADVARIMSMTVIGYLLV